MKKFIASFIAVFALLTIGTTQQAMANNEPANMQSERVVSRSYYTGTIGNNMHITMYLERHDNGEYSGWYYYNKYGEKNKLYLVGEKDTDGLVKLFEFNDQNQLTAGFEGTFNRYGEFVGIMYVVHSGKRYSCKFYPANF